jgi:competence protein ComEC
VLEPFLRHSHIRHIDGAFVSHANLDHYNALPKLAESGRISHLYLTPQFSNDAMKSTVASALLKIFGAAHIAPETLHAGDRRPIDSNTSLDVLWPPSDESLVANDSSMVLRLICYGKTVLFTGDIEQMAEKSLALDPRRAHADILIAPHHGSSESTTPALVQAVNPNLIISSNDDTPTSKQRRFDREMKNRNVMHTDRYGAVTIVLRPDGSSSVTPFVR